jgi:GDP-6-deoxy-D-talose 4-dehydrogenase
MGSVGNMSVLVTGIAGFTGCHLLRRLHDAGYDVIGLGSEPCSLVPTYLRADLEDTARISAWLRQVQPSFVIHLAALSHVVGDAIGFYRVNVLGTESLLQAIVDAGIEPQKIVIASSANIYGNALVSPITEEAPIRPVNHYGVSKAAMELMLCKWQERLSIIVTRPFNYTGPGQSEAFLFPKLVGAFHRKDPVIMLGNIDVARDLSDVNFVVEAYVRLLQSAVRSERFNICSGKSLSIRASLDLLSGLTGHRPEIAIDPALVRPDEIAELCGDPARLQAAVGPIPNYDPVEIFGNMLDAYDNSEFQKIV